MSKKGFTLAEVLITLGVIGVVAAMTLPIVIANYQKQVTVNRLKKVTSILQQAIIMSKVDNGNTWEWDFGDRTPESNEKFFKKYLFPYIKIIKNCEPEKNSECFSKYVYMFDEKTVQNEINEKWSTFILADGTAIASKLNSKELTFRVDINGKKNPNRTARDIFCYSMFIPVSPNDDILYQNIYPCFIKYNRENIIKSNGSCASDKTSHGFGCSALIQQDGWKIAPDYPW